MGSLSYPTNEWIDLGNYTVSTDSLSAINSKVMQYVQDFNMITNRLNEKAERAAQASMTAAMEVSVDGTVATGQEFGMENLVEPEDDADMIDMELYEQAKAIRSLPQPIPFTSAPGEEIFPLKLSSPVWTRYLKFKFNEFQGREYYCTLTQVCWWVCSMQHFSPI